MINVVGEGVDLINAGISVARGNYADAALDASSAIPFAGNIIGAGKLANRAGKVLSKSPVVNSTTKPLRRPYLRKSTREAIQSAAPKTPDGKFIDPNTGQVIKGKFPYGHKYGHEHRRLKAEAKVRGMTQKEFNDYINKNPQFFQIEDPISNMSHRFEKPGR